MTITETQITLGGASAILDIRVNPRAKRLILKVDPVRGRILVTAPSKRAVPEAIAFAKSRAHWLEQQLATGARAIPFAAGDIAPFEGAPHRIIAAPDRRASVRLRRPASETAPGEISVGGDPAFVNRRMVDWLKTAARRRLTERADIHCRELGVKRGRITIRDTRSRWGSCSSSGAISFSWRLILTPPAILDYVAAHECAHLVHLDHSDAYWRVVASLGVDAGAASRWFEKNGARLHAYGVEA